MHPADEYAALKDQIRQIEARSDVLRQGFLGPEGALKSNRHEVVVRMQTRNTFVKDRLPPEILSNPTYWEERRSPIVTLRDLAPDPGPRRLEEVRLLEPWD